VRTYSEITKRITLSPATKSYKWARLSTNEKRRRQIVESFSSLPFEAQPRLERLLASMSDADQHFLGGNTEVEVETAKDQTKTWKGAVAVAVSRRHWSEQFLVLSRDQLILQRSRDAKKAVIALSLSDIHQVRALSPEHCPVKWLGFLEVVTFSRVFTFMVHSDMQINGWLEAFMTVGLLSRIAIPRPPKDSFREEVFIARPACWKTDKKRVYNYRRIAFDRNLCTSEEDSSQIATPNALSEEILRAAFVLSKFASDDHWLRFWDLIAQLQNVCLVGISEAQKMAFFLNIYHVMVIHGCLMFGPPPAWNHWNAFFNNISYIVGFELVSIAEVEHCILR